jgi:hypothetical protein
MYVNNHKNEKSSKRLDNNFIHNNSHRRNQYYILICWYEVKIKADETVQHVFKNLNMPRHCNAKNKIKQYLSKPILQYTIFLEPLSALPMNVALLQ